MTLLPGLFTAMQLPSLNKKRWVLVPLLGLLALCAWACVSNLKEPISGRHQGDWIGVLHPATFVDEVGREVSGYLLKVDTAPNGDSLMKRSVLAGTSLALAAWPDVGSGDDDRQFKLFSDEHLEKGLRVKVSGEALIGQLVLKEGVPLSLKGEQQGRLEFILRIRKLKREN